MLKLNHQADDPPESLFIPEVTRVSRYGRICKKSSRLADFESPDEIDSRLLKSPQETIKQEMGDDMYNDSDGYINEDLLVIKDEPVEVHDWIDFNDDDEVDENDCGDLGSETLQVDEDSTDMPRETSSYNQLTMDTVEDSRLSLCVATANFVVDLAALMKKPQKKHRRYWVKPWMARKSKNIFNNLLKEMCLEDEQGFCEYHRMSKKNFVELLELVSPLIRKQDTKMRKSISPAQRLSITLRYLATGESQRSLEFQYRTSHSLISSIIPEVCDAISTSLKSRYLKLPTTAEEWQEVASVFDSVWNFPMCIGALDGKRFLTRIPVNCGSEYIDSKTHHRFIILALVDASYKFLYVDVGAAQGRRSKDARLWDKCSLRKWLREKRLQVPGPTSLPYSNIQSPYVIAGHDAFPLKTYLMKPYSGRNIAPQQKIFNYRLSRARRVSENAFGILAAKFRVFQSPINSNPDHVKKIVFASVVLHNYLIVNCKTYLTPELLQREDINRCAIVPGVWEEAPCALEDLPVIPKGHCNEAKKVRDDLKDYFTSSGQVPWQERMAVHH